ncbi:MAG: hypothetical protein K6T86_21960 [Pirellulales bacterium]|nr:hypothetical protein [Pirellulales bacterium]
MPVVSSAVGRIVSFVSPDGTSLYQYDETGQLVLADHDYQPDEQHQFDANGNRVTSGYQVGANNRLLSDGVFDYEYDNEGNLIRRTRISSDLADDHVMELAWDHRNRLTRVVFKNNQGAVTREVLYTYDVFDRRIRKQIDWDGEGEGLAEAIAHVYDQDDIVLAFDGTGSLTNRYLHGPPPSLGLAATRFWPTRTCWKTTSSGRSRTIWGQSARCWTIRAMPSAIGCSAPGARSSRTRTQTSSSPSPSPGASTT